MSDALRNISEAVGEFAQAISRVLHVDVEIVDSDLVRVAGTGRFAAAVGQCLGDAGRVYRHVLSTGEPCVIHEPGYAEVCRLCPHWQNCEECFEMSTPILMNHEVIGVIGFVCFTPAQREHILGQYDTLFDLLVQMGTLIASKALEMQEFQKRERVGELLERIVDKVDEGVILLDEDARILRDNAVARKVLGLPEPEDGDSPIPPRPASQVRLIKGSGRIMNRHEYELAMNGKRFDLVGEEFPLRHGECHRVFVFRDAQMLHATALRLASAQEKVGLDALICESESMRSIKAQVRRVANSASTVLITGESGTGKELMARALHMESDIAAGPLVTVNCGAIPEALLESELFGYVRGAFTGADPKGRIGKFEQADGGTLFLDEIGDMPLHLQVKLLRALEQREITRLGAHRPVSIKVRVIAATNKELEQMVDEGSFRDDLFYRLNVIPLHVPPLRERPEDITPLTLAFVERYVERLEKRLVRVDNSFFEALMDYPWPGNVRELQNVVEFAINMMDSPGVLHRDLLPAKVTTPTAPADPPDLNLERMERACIAKALGPFGGAGASKADKERVADLLGIGVATLYRKIKKYGL